MTKRRIAILSLSAPGTVLAARLRDGLDASSDVFVPNRFADMAGNDATAFELPVRPLIERLFAEYRSLVLFMPVGAAVRLIASSIASKHRDPAVVCVDDAGRFAVSLLSGHAGGADELTERVAKALGATAVITSASHALGMFAVDLLGKTHGWRVESPSEDVTRVSAAVMNGNPIAFYQDCGEPIDLDELPYSVQVCDSKESLEASQADFALIVSDCGAARSWFHGRHAVVYRPRSLIVGVGCRANVPCDELDELLSTTFEAHSLALKSIRTFATAEIKRSEPGIIQLAAKHDASLVCFDADALNSRPGPSGPSAAQKHFGVVGVCEPAAMLAANVDGLVVPKTVSRRATVAVARMEFARG